MYVATYIAILGITTAGLEICHLPRCLWLLNFAALLAVASAASVSLLPIVKFSW